jgi:hypothetical protein
MIKEIERVTRGCLDICWGNKTRHIENNNVPFLSRDEVLGMAFLDKKIAKELIETNWWMCNKPQEFNLIDFIEQIYLLIKHRADRNFWWKNNLDQMMYLTMKLPIVDRCFVYKCADIKAPWYYRLIEWIDKKKKPNGRSSRAIRSFKYNQDNFEGIMLYFDLEHPLRKYLEEKRNATR